MTARVLASVWVPGVPRTQGSMMSVGRGRMKHSDALVAWRSLVAAEVQRDARLRGTPERLTPDGAYGGPVAVRCVFVRGDGVGDIDKLTRAVLDALTDSGVIADDVQVVKLVCDRVDGVGGFGDGAFVLVATVDDSQEAHVRVQNALLDEIHGWVGPR